MARLARIAIAQLPYHVTQRGNRRQAVFFQEEDYRMYLCLLQEESQRWQLKIWAYCLMTNHIHLIVWPETDHGLTRAIAETHRRYTRHINFREGWRGYLWQGRFGSVPLDESHAMAALRYVEHNPVAAGLVSAAGDYPWSSARAHLTGQSDPVLSPHPFAEQIPDWAAFLASAVTPELQARLERHLRTGRPLGAAPFIDQLEQASGRSLQPRRPGPKPVGVQ